MVNHAFASPRGGDVTAESVETDCGSSYNAEHTVLARHTWEPGIARRADLHRIAPEVTEEAGL